MGSTLDAFTEKIAQPFDDAAPIVRNIANLYEGSNRNLKQHQTTLTATFSGLGANAFIDMINKQVKWVDGIVGRLRELASFYETCARDIRQAASYISGPIAPFLDIEQWVLDRLTPHIVAEHGESAIHAVFNDMRGQLNREMHDASGFFSDLVHGHFGAALNDAEDSVKGIAHLGGDVLAMVSSVESLLSQWAADIYSAVNWAMNKLNSWGLSAENWLFSLSDIADETVVFTDPNSTSEEKWAAGIEMGVNIVLDIGMVVPGADVVALGGKGVIKLLEKFGLKAVIDEIAKKAVTRITETVVAQVMKNFTKRFVSKLAEKYSEVIVERGLKKSLTQAVFKNLEQDIKPGVENYIQAIIQDWLAGKISAGEAHTEIQALVSFSNKYGADRLKYILKNYDPEALKVILNGDHLPALHPNLPWEAWHFGPNQPRTLIPKNFIMRVGENAYYVNANATKHLAEYTLSKGNHTFPLSTLADVIKNAQEKGLLKPGTGKQFLKLDHWELGIDTNEHVIYHIVYRP
ncbi:hypothetical protein KDH_50570 [Dictyobacter sp. S3.2.2.5]|uniref:LXG domain-containing protein n=1 Tax=Dictyobacter halimunensis TaxID=3026934 RepID=A0ABQ6FVD6_9CHLR|nr:hypothetical protein KDH_50570 [Dictyobacter sp. S3.2.2.5]